MSKVYEIYRNKKYWSRCDTGSYTKSKFEKREKLYEINYGRTDDYLKGIEELYILMRKSVYDNVMSGNFIISDESQSKLELTLEDKNGDVVPMFKEGEIY